MTSIGRLAGVIDALQSGERAATVIGAKQRRHATVGRAGPGRRAIGGRRAGRDDAIVEVAALVGGAIGVGVTLGRRLAEEAVTHRAARAIGVVDAFARVDTAV